MGLFDKITTKLLGGKSDTEKIKNKYEQSLKFVDQKNKSILNHSKETINEYLASRSCYKQFIRMFIDGKISKALSAESKVMIDDIKKAGFDILKLPNRAAIIKAISDEIEKEIKKNSYPIANTVFQVYYDTLKVLTNAKLLNFIRTIYKKIEPICKKEFSKNQSDQERQMLYKCSFLINAYVSLIFLFDNMTLQFGHAPILENEEVLASYGMKKSELLETIENSYKKVFKYFFDNILLHHIELITYFDKTDLNLLIKEINTNISESISKESWDEKKKELYYMYGTEDITFAILVACGVALGLTLLLPTIRGLIYYWGCLKINLANFYKDDSIYLSFNIKRLKEELAKETDPKKIAKLEQVIAKQEAECEKLKQKAYNLSVQYENNVSQTRNNMETDTEIEDNEYYESKTPTILI